MKLHECDGCKYFDAESICEKRKSDLSCYCVTENIYTITQTKLAKSLYDRKYIVKISLSMDRYRNNVENVVYYNREIPYHIFQKYLWYFELLAAKVKVAFPKRKVWLEYFDDILPTKDEYISKKRKTLLSAKKGKLTKLHNELLVADNDLFGLSKEKINNKINRVQNEIKDLESGKIIFHVPYLYKNEIKKFISKNV